MKSGKGHESKGHNGVVLTGQEAAKQATCISAKLFRRCVASG